jgi:DNA (cytosine-5)-methyltransferase 1
MNFGSVCSGIEAASVAWHPLGYRAAWLAEIEAFPAAVLAHHYPQVPNLGDMTQIATEVLSGTAAAPDVLVGGTPCQAFSVAGMRAGLQDARGKLTIEFVRLADAIDHVRIARGEQPAITVWENVPGVLSDRGNAFGCFLGALAGEDCELQPSGKRWTDAGCVYGPKRAIAWRVLDAQYFGLAQRRRRVFVVASAREGFDPASVLFEREGVRRDTPPRRVSEENLAGTIEASAGRSRGAGISSGILTTGTLRASNGGSDVDHAVACHLVAGTLNANGKAAGSATQQDVESGLLVVHGTQDPCVSNSTAFALGRNSGGENAVCVTGDIAHTLKAEGFDASEDGTGRGQPIVAALRGISDYGDGLPCLRAKGGDAAGGSEALISTSAVRRLTPVECERLQGFPDNYTQVPYRNKEAADGPRYKALGNSMAVPVMRWIGERIALALGAEMQEVA